MQFDPKKMTVEGRTENLLRKNSPLMTLQSTRAKQQANQRGLLNTQGAISAGQAAVMRTAIDIAKPDAALQGQNWLSRQKHTDDMGILGQQQANQLAQMDRGQQHTLGKLGQQHTNQLAQMDRGQQHDIGTLGFRADASLRELRHRTDQDRQMAGQAQAASLNELNLQLNQRKRETASNVGLQREQMQRSGQERMAASVSRATDSLVSGFEFILRDPDLTAAGKRAAMNTLSHYNRSGQRAAARILGLNLQW